MTDRLATAGHGDVQNGTPTSPRYDWRAHVAWVMSLESPAVGRLRLAGRSERRGSRPWREVGVAELGAGVGGDRGKRHLEQQRRPARVLPRALRPLAAALARHDFPPLEGPVGKSIRDPARVRRLQDLCRAVLRSEPLGNTDARALQRLLDAIDPPGPVYLRASAATSVGVDEAVALHATHAAAGSWIAGPPTAGWPAIGTVRGAQGDELLIELGALPVPTFKL